MNNGAENVKTERNGGVSALLEALGYLTPIAPSCRSSVCLGGGEFLGRVVAWGEINFVTLPR